MEGYGNAEFPVTEDPVAEKHLPLGNYISPDISLVLGDVLESWNFLCSVHEALGLKNILSLEEIMTGLNGFLSNGLSEAHVSILQILLGDLQVESKHSKISNMGCSTAAERTKFEVTLLNELTWLEVARRYALVFPSMNMDLKSETICEGIDVLRYLHADGGPLGGALTGIRKLKVDTWLLEDAMTKIYGSLNYNDDMLIIDDTDYENGSACQNVMVDEGGPDWVEELKPVKLLKTNVGSKIKKCIQNSLQKCPPEWAVEKLEHSISKEVYKANASGPTKKAALGVIAQFYSMQQNVPSRTERRQFISMSDIVLKKCRVVLRKTAAAFYNLARGNSTVHGDKDWHSSTPVVVSRLPIFRNIDMRLATGAYGGSHEAFFEDVWELYRDLPNAFDKLAGDFELSYKKEVVALQQRLSNYKMLAYLNANTKKEIKNVISASKICKAPWEGLCKLCCIDEKDAKVLLCDDCDEEYHTFCLNPPRPKVPKGRWLCPCCNAAPAPATLLVVRQQKKKNVEATNLILNEFADLVDMLHEKDYWDLSVRQRTILLKVFCGQFLNSDHIKEHLENLMQKNSFRSDFVGIDSSGRLYWIMDSGSGPWIIVNERNKLNQNDANCPLTIEEVHGMSSAYSSLACYRSDVESEKIINFLLEDDKLMKEKLESMLHMHKSRLRVSRNSKSQDVEEIQPTFMKPNYVLHNSNSLMTKAIKLLQSKYGLVVKLETPNLRKDDSEKGKLVEGVFYRCEFLEPILPGKLHCDCCHKTFITETEFQLHLHGDGSCNIPLIMPFKNGGIRNTLKGERASVSVNKESETQSVEISEGMEQDYDTLQSQRVPALEIYKFFEVPVCSLRQLTGNACEVLTHLKINLLDMEAALSENAVRSSKSSVGKRLAWRAFVKSASTIYEMVQAMTVLEDMINTNYLDLSWRHSSSWSAAATISTLSALSFRIYSLDAAISYDEISCSLKPTELDSGSDKEKRQQNLKSTGKRRRKPNKKDEGTS